MEYQILHNGVEMPTLGFGCYKLPQETGTDVILHAIETGYRHFDTASVYQTEQMLGQAIRRSGIPREEFFITSKLWKTQMEDPQLALEETLGALDMDYLDLYLIHWPRPDLSRRAWKELDRSVWHSMEQFYKKGAVRAIGTSNFLPHHLMNLFSACTIRPMVNQLEFHPGYTQEAAVRYCQEEKIVVGGWSPLGRMSLHNDPLLLELANHYQVTVPQICLRFAIQSDVIPIPKSASPQRMKENMDVFGFELSQEDMFRIRTMPPVAWLGEHPDRERKRD